MARDKLFAKRRSLVKQFEVELVLAELNEGLRLTDTCVAILSPGCGRLKATVT
jgi:hypothetical protein